MGYTHRTIISAVRNIAAPYNIEHIDVVGNVYKSNNMEIGALRGFGATEGCLVIETMVDRAARRLGLNPVEIRRRNWLEKDTIEHHFPGSLWKLVSDKVTLDETLAKILKAAGQKPEPSKGGKVGRGVAVGMPAFEIGNTPGYQGTGADITMFQDGSLNVRVGFPEVGQGITGVITRLASQALGISEDRISIVLCDSHTTPKAGSLGFSRGTVNCGNALLSACQQLKQKLENYAKEYLKTDADVKYKSGHFFIGDQLCLKFEEFMDFCYYKGRDLTASGRFEGPDLDDKRGVTFVAGLVDVEVDEDTGEVRIIRVINCHDVGKVIHEPSARGQLVGSALMALGFGRSEEFLMKNGRTITPTLAEYLIPTAKDIPDENIALFHECPGENCPVGAKGLGEHGVHAIGPALINAITDATGVELTEIPITPERVLKALGRL